MSRENNPFFKRQKAAGKRAVWAFCLSFLYSGAVSYFSGLIDAPRGGPLLPLVIVMVVWIPVYWVGEVFDSHWIIAQLICIGLISAITFLPFVL